MLPVADIVHPQGFVHSTVRIPKPIDCFSNTVTAGGTQVKWNRQDPNVLASSHMDEVLIWDRRVSLLVLLHLCHL